MPAYFQLLIALLLAFGSCNDPKKDLQSSSSIQSVNIPAKTIRDISLPLGFKYVENGDTSYSRWLLDLAFKENNTVYLYNGIPKSDQNVQYGVLNIDIGKKDLIQCADAVMKLRADFLFEKHRYSELNFTSTSGDSLSFEKWLKGVRWKEKVDATAQSPKREIHRHRRRIAVGHEQAVEVRPREGIGMGVGRLLVRHHRLLRRQRHADVHVAEHHQAVPGVGAHVGIDALLHRRGEGEPGVLVRLHLRDRGDDVVGLRDEAGLDRVGSLGQGQVDHVHALARPGEHQVVRHVGGVVVLECDRHRRARRHGEALDVVLQAADGLDGDGLGRRQRRGGDEQAGAEGGHAHGILHGRAEW